MDADLKEFRRLQRVCLDLAEVAPSELERTALQKVAEDYRHACDAIENQRGWSATGRCMRKIEAHLAYRWSRLRQRR